MSGKMWPYALSFLVASGVMIPVALLIKACVTDNMGVVCLISNVLGIALIAGSWSIIHIVSKKKEEKRKMDDIYRIIRSAKD